MEKGSQVHPGLIMDPVLVTSIKALLDEASSKEKATQILQEGGHCWRSQISPTQVGVHPSNRDGLGVAVPEVLSLIQDILSVGFADQQYRAWCVELDGQQEIRDFNAKLARESQRVFLDMVRSLALISTAAWCVCCMDARSR